MQPGTSFQRSDSPPWQRRGGRDIKKDAAKPPYAERTGRFVPLPINRWVGRTAPSAPVAEASRLLLMGAATPPLTRRGMAYPKDTIYLYLTLFRIVGGDRPPLQSFSHP